MELTREERQAAAYLELVAAGHEMVANSDQSLDPERVRILIDTASELREAAEAIRRGEHRNQ
jgi:hypothetical protein